MRSFGGPLFRHRSTEPIKIPAIDDCFSSNGKMMNGGAIPAAASKFNIAYFQPIRILEAIMGLPTLSHFLSSGCANP
jgi:hypothetical protein